VDTFIERIIDLFWAAKFAVTTTVLENEVKIRKFIGLVLAVPPIMFLVYLVVDGVYQSWQLSVGIERPDDTVPVRFIFLALILTLVGVDIYINAKYRTIFRK
jgi:hypothetical protein